jgi:hypothetical protein
MQQYRITIRYGHPRRQYHVLDLEAATLADALRDAAEALSSEISATADLAEVRLQVEAEAREYTEG